LVRAQFGEAAADRLIEQAGALPLDAKVVVSIPESRRDRTVIRFPLRFDLPWSALVSENRRFCARGNRIFMTEEYKRARAKTTSIVRGILRGAEPLSIPLSLTALVHFPDNRIHDAPNFAGATHNALKGIIYTDDRWLYRASWERDVVDVDSPRAEITIMPYVSPRL
jgi:Holliday junction resolvase RusA-like endonuclease